MDSISQALLGASIGELLGGKRWGSKAPFIGALLGTLPDLDVFVGPLLFGDTLQAEQFHRTITHSLMFSVLVAPVIGNLLASRIQDPSSHGSAGWSKKHPHARLHRTLLSFWCLATHWMLDTLTGYGTMWLWPFSPTFYSLDSVFIIDPLYTIPFLILFFIALRFPSRSPRRAFRNRLALLVSTCYLLWGIGVKGSASYSFSQSLEQQGIIATHIYTSPELATTFLRRGRAQDNENRYIGRRSIFDRNQEISRKVISKNNSLIAPYLADKNVQDLLKRRNYRVAFRSSSEGTIEVIPIQFGDFFGRTRKEFNGMLSHTIGENTAGIYIQDAGRGRDIPSNRFALLIQRILGKSV